MSFAIARHRTASLRRATTFALLTSLWACDPLGFEVVRKEASPVYKQGVRSISVGHISGFGGEDLAQLIRHQLVKKSDLQLIDTALPVLPHPNDPNFDAQLEAYRQQKTWQGPDAILTGTMFTPQVELAYASREHDRGLRTNTTYERTATIRASAVFQLVDAQDGRVLDSFELCGRPITATLTRTMEGHTIADSGYAASLFYPIDAFQESRAALTTLRDQLCESFAPTTHREVVKLWKHTYEEGDAAVARAAGRGDWGPALAYYAKRVKEAQTPEALAEALYYQGIALAYGGEREAGIATLERSHQLLPNAVVERALQKIRGW